MAAAAFLVVVAGVDVVMTVAAAGSLAEVGVVPAAETAAGSSSGGVGSADAPPAGGKFYSFRLFVVI